MSGGASQEGDGVGGAGLDGSDDALVRGQTRVGVVEEVHLIPVRGVKGLGLSLMVEPPVGGPEAFGGSDPAAGRNGIRGIALDDGLLKIGLKEKRASRRSGRSRGVLPGALSTGARGSGRGGTSSDGRLGREKMQGRRNTDEQGQNDGDGRNQPLLSAFLLILPLGRHPQKCGRLLVLMRFNNHHAGFASRADRDGAIQPLGIRQRLATTGGGFDAVRSFRKRSPHGGY